MTVHDTRRNTPGRSLASAVCPSARNRAVATNVRVNMQIPVVGTQPHCLGTVLRQTLEPLAGRRTMRSAGPWAVLYATADSLGCVGDHRNDCGNLALF